MKNIVIVGGGTSGWLAATFLASVLPDTCQEEFTITLIESSDIPTIGVGEATTPSLKVTLSAIGVNECDFMRSCDATFKHGIKFCNWKSAQYDDPQEYYFHPFQAPTRISVESIARHWINKKSGSFQSSFADVACVQKKLAEAGFSPKLRNSPGYDGPLPYAYHLDAGKLAEYLKGLGIAKGVRHVIGEVDDIAFDEFDFITKLTLKKGGSYSPDLVIDCTGFAARLINADGKNHFVSKNEQLFCNRALATRIKISSLKDIVPYTRSTATKNGWIWDINLMDRRGVGHVYSSRHSSDDVALLELANYVGIDPSELEHRQLKMRIGFHDQQWRGNCVAIGLSAGFLEPLESTGIYLTEMAIWLLSQSIPRFFNGADPMTKFNAVMIEHFENIADFIKLHYRLTERTDSDFWKENADPETSSKNLQRLLEVWENDIPNDYDFESRIQCFSSDNYQYVLYGMTDPSAANPHDYQRSSAALEKIQQVTNVSYQRLAHSLLSHEKILGHIAQGKDSSLSTPVYQHLNTGSNYRLA